MAARFQLSSHRQEAARGCPGGCSGNGPGPAWLHGQTKSPGHGAGCAGQACAFHPDHTHTDSSRQGHAVEVTRAQCPLPECFPQDTCGLRCWGLPDGEVGGGTLGSQPCPKFKAAPAEFVFNIGLLCKILEKRIPLFCRKCLKLPAYGIKQATTSGV